jgi:hypothetical protein
VDQFDAEAFFKSSNLLAHGGLADAAFFRHC